LRAVHDRSLHGTTAAVEHVLDPAVVRVPEPGLGLLGCNRSFCAREHRDVCLGPAVVVVERGDALLAAREHTVDRARGPLLAHAVPEVVGADRTVAAARDGAEQEQCAACKRNQSGGAAHRPTIASAPRNSRTWFGWLTP